MSDGAPDMDAMIAKLGALPGMVGRAAPAVAEAFDAELQRNIAAGVGPDGTPWRATKDGREPLVNAGDALSVKAVGNVVLARLDGIEARHHLGAIRGSSKSNWLARPILPNAKIPKPVTTAIAAVLEGEFKKTMGAR